MSTADRGHVPICSLRSVSVNYDGESGRREEQGGNGGGMDAVQIPREVTQMAELLPQVRARHSQGLPGATMVTARPLLYQRPTSSFLPGRCNI